MNLNGARELSKAVFEPTELARAVERLLRIGLAAHRVGQLVGGAVAAVVQQKEVCVAIFQLLVHA